MWRGVPRFSSDREELAMASYLSDYRVANEGCSLEHAAELARGAGVVTDSEAGTWIAALRAQAAAGHFWCAVMAFTVAGRRV
jgi:hypothetical protein